MRKIWNFATLEVMTAIRRCACWKSIRTYEIRFKNVSYENVNDFRREARVRNGGRTVYTYSKWSGFDILVTLCANIASSIGVCSEGSTRNRTLAIVRQTLGACKVMYIFANTIDNSPTSVIESVVTVSKFGEPHASSGLLLGWPEFGGGR